MSDRWPVVVIGPHYWGAGDDVAAAKANFRKEGGVLSNGYAIVEFPPELRFTGVDMLGQVHWEGDVANHEPKVTQVPPRGRGAVWA